GKKCSPYELRSVAFGEPLDKGEAPGSEGVSALDEGPVDVQIDEDFSDEISEADASPEAPAPIEQTGQAGQLLSGAAKASSSDEPVDFGDWEPTLF
ncbi:MAG: hypothetical protein J6T89_04690, partial [Bacteroidales bacterium]|nr:hypothetical protein [Bacteroidales bacterium]